jgi:hypothetical protein
MDGTVAFYNRTNLFERINGESELYFPYGFEQLASARYTDTKNPQSAIEADIYKMGSLLDAFGMYANYRRKDDPDARIGGEGSISGTQLFFYQDRYLVRLQATGDGTPPPAVFLACAKTIARNLPVNPGRPKELEGIAIPEAVAKSQRYIAASLLGYDFFRRGLMADVMIMGEEAQLILVPEDSPKAARQAFDAYRSYLAAAGNITPLETPGRIGLSAVDPMYGKVVVELVDRYVVGVVKAQDLAEAKRLVGLMRKIIEKR